MIEPTKLFFVLGGPGTRSTMGGIMILHWCHYLVVRSYFPSAVGGRLILYMTCNIDESSLNHHISNQVSLSLSFFFPPASCLHLVLNVL